MFVSFDLFVFLFWLVVSTVIPGAILSLSIFHKDERLLLIEKLFIGFALTVIMLPILPFLLYLVAGVEYSYVLALISVALVYAVALAFFVKNGLHKEVLSPEFKAKLKLPQIKSSDLLSSKEFLITSALFLLLLVTYIIRITSYSPIFQELDPYYYTYVSQQILTLGHNPVNDQTAWFPEVTVSHREIPALSYLESIYYSLYTNGGKFNNLTLSLVASMYPPIMALFFVFFIYMLISAVGKREWGVIAAGIASFAPMMIIKLAAGAPQVVPYTFFILPFFYALFALSFKFRDMKFYILTAIALFAAALGSNSFSLTIAAIMIFTVLQSILLFLANDREGIKHLLILNVFIFVLGSLVGQSLLMNLFRWGVPSFFSSMPHLLCIAFAAGLYFIMDKFTDKKSSGLVIPIILLVGFLVFMFTPIGGYVKEFASSGLNWAQFVEPLDRTIAEQNLAGSDLSGQIGSIAAPYTVIVSQFFGPLVSTPSPPQSIMQLVGGIGNLVSIILSPFTIIANVGLSLITAFLNLTLGSNVVFDAKDNTFMLFWLVAFWVASIYSLFLLLQKKTDNLFVLLLAITMPPFIVGIIKAKLLTYAAFSLALMVGFSLSVADGFFDSYFKNENSRKKAYHCLLAFGIILVLLQFTFNGFPISLLMGSTQILYQNNPAALAPKFQQICAATNDSDICAAAADPLGYASKGTNYQYNYKLCLVSAVSDVSYLSNPSAAPSGEMQSAYFRCQRLSNYWVDSMEWIRDNTEPGARITSWWDYGHWINYFGQRNAVIRNEHSSKSMIGEVAYGYLEGTPDELKNWMLAHDSKYALFDMELVSSGSSLGGKYGALNYLSCARNNETTVASNPGESKCELDHLWEVIFVSNSTCTISPMTNKTGLLTYKMYAGNTVLQYYPDYCNNPPDQKTSLLCKQVFHAEPTYCLGETTLANGQKTYAPYRLNDSYPNGDLKLQKALLQANGQIQTVHMGAVTQATTFYTNDQMWLENGQLTSGYSDRTTKFYDSNLYRALFLNDLPGFKLVYTTPDGMVKIYKIDGSS